MNYVLYNPLAGNGEGGERIRPLRESLPPRESRFADIRTLRGEHREHLWRLLPTDRLILAGGDGTLHRFLCFLEGGLPPCDLYLYPTGNSNRFYHRHARGQTGMIGIRDAVKCLPLLRVSERIHPILNGVGVGLDGFLREEERRHGRHSEEPMSVPLAQAKGLLFGVKPFSAEVTVDGSISTLSLVRALSFTGTGPTEGGLRLPRELRPVTEGRLCALALVGLERYRIPSLLPSLVREGFPKKRTALWSAEGTSFSVRLSAPQTLAIDGELHWGVSAFSIQFPSEEETV